MKKIKVNILFGYIILIFVAVSTSLFGIFIVNQFKSEQKPQVIIEKPIEKPSLYPDYDVIKGSSKSADIKQINITSDCPEAGCINSKPATVNFDGINKIYSVHGKFSRAYLYIQALVDYNRPLTSWDDIFFTINWVGGHLIADDDSLPVPPGDTTQILYKLSSISYYVNLDDKLKRNNLKSNVNLFSYLQDDNTLNIRVTLSSDRPGRVLKQVSIYYQCFQGSNCSIDSK